MSFEHRRVTPQWPRANGAVESCMKKLAKVIQWAKMSNTPRTEALQSFLRVYRDTPHSTTKVAPSALMFGHSRTSGIPQVNPTHKQQQKFHIEARANDERAKARMATEYDARMKTRETTFTIGDRVLIKVDRKSKADMPWDPKPLTVVKIKGSMITAARAGLERTRNSSCFKHWFDQSEYDDDDDDVGKTTTTTTQLNDQHSGHDSRSSTSPSQPRAATSSHQQVDNEAVGQTRRVSNQPADAQDERVPEHVTVRRRGRPTKAESVAIEFVRSALRAQEMSLHPPTRSSARLRDKAQAQEGGGSCDGAHITQLSAECEKRSCS